MPKNCTVCGKVFRKKVHLNNHVKSNHADEKLFDCNTCGKKFIYLNMLKRHKKIHNESDSPSKKSNEDVIIISEKDETNNWAEQLPSESMTNHKNVVNHIEIVSPIVKNIEESSKANVIFLEEVCFDDNICEVDEKMECSEGSLKNIVEQVSTIEKTDNILLNLNEINDPLSNKTLDVETYPDELNTIFLHEESINENVFEVEEVGMKEIVDQTNEYNMKLTFECEICKRKFKRPVDLVSHKLVHNQVFISGNRYYQCKECGENFEKISSLKKHRVIHTSENPYKCTECDINFSHSQDLLNHVQTHYNKPYVCLICSKSCIRPDELALHMRTHDEDFIECKICGENFNNSEDLHIHELTHATKKLFKCNTCGLEFPQSKNLQKHKKIHVEKSFKCEICGKGFSRKFDIQRHSIVHTGVKAYNCKDCGKKFGRCSDLVRHGKLHTGERPYSCDVCGKSFIELCKLKLHKKNVHIGNQNYKCITCGHGFNNLTFLKNHQRTFGHYDTTNKDDNLINEDTILTAVFDESGNINIIDNEYSIVADEDGNLFQNALSSSEQNYETNEYSLNQETSNNSNSQNLVEFKDEFIG